MTVPLAILAVVLLTLALTTVFYAAHSARPLNIKTGIAAVGFLVLALTLWLIGALG
jgi:hypothetical protein